MMLGLMFASGHIYIGLYAALYSAGYGLYVSRLAILILCVRNNFTYRQWP
jgi:hypothetical protein